MLPFRSYVVNGDTIYLAIQAKYADRVSHILAAIPGALEQLEEFRVFLVVFSDRIEYLYICTEATVDALNDVFIWPGNQREGNAIDPVIGVVMADDSAEAKREHPTLFIFSDGDVTCHWNPGTLTQVMNIVWLNEPSSEPMLTPFGQRHEVNL